jgi:hypothetical protein
MNTPAKIVKKSDLKNYFPGKKSDLKTMNNEQ